MSFRFEAAERHVLIKGEKALDFKWMQFVETNNADARQSAEKQRKQSERVELKAKWAI